MGSGTLMSTNSPIARAAVIIMTGALFVSTQAFKRETRVDPNIAQQHHSLKWAGLGSTHSHQSPAYLRRPQRQHATTKHQCGMWRNCSTSLIGVSGKVSQVAIGFLCFRFSFLSFLAVQYRATQRPKWRFKNIFFIARCSFLLERPR